MGYINLFSSKSLRDLFLYVFRFKFRFSKSEFAVMHQCLLKFVAGSDKAQKPFRSTQATILVDSLVMSSGFIWKKKEQKSSGGRIRFRPAGT
ncbi:hypothetical protein EO95_17540 [Methanosarcina sp. 1.H.T.1A.1]|nr:hypothetical protein EO95_17540 [Methanosarcina sp. 1.H.T.1A.1]